MEYNQSIWWQNGEKCVVVIIVAVVVEVVEPQDWSLLDIKRMNYVSAYSECTNFLISLRVCVYVCMC